MATEGAMDTASIRETGWTDAVPGGEIRRVPLSWPLRSGRRRLRWVDLRPPTLGDLEVLSAALGISAVDVLVAASDVPANLVRRLRWPDVAALLQAARDFFPEGFFDRFEPPDTSARSDGRGDASQSATSTVTEEAPSEPTDPDDETLPSADAVDMADFMTPFRF